MLKIPDNVDRIQPTMRPNRPSAGTQRWRDLLFVHWKVPASLLRSIVPDELTIDTFEGDAFVGLVPFQMRNIKPRWLPERLAFNFLETNVRTYVVHNGRPGVYFFSLDANSRLAVWAARKGWSLPYVFAKMQSEREDGLFTYSSVRPNGSGLSRISFRVGDHLGVSEIDTLEHFLFERYLLFVKHRKQILVGQVHHTPYDVSTAEIQNLDQRLLADAGLKGFDKSPSFAHYSPGVDVEVFAISPSLPGR